MNRSCTSKLSRAGSIKGCRLTPPLSTHLGRLPYKGGSLSYYTWLISSGLKEMKYLSWLNEWEMNQLYSKSTVKSGWRVTLALSPSSFCHPWTSYQSTLTEARVHVTFHSEVSATGMSPPVLSLPAEQPVSSAFSKFILGINHSQTLEEAFFPSPLPLFPPVPSAGPDFCPPSSFCTRATFRAWLSQAYAPLLMRLWLSTFVLSLQSTKRPVSLSFLLHVLSERAYM